MEVPKLDIGLPASVIVFYHIHVPGNKPGPAPAAPAGYEDEIFPVPEWLLAEPAEGTAAGYPGLFLPVCKDPGRDET